MDNATAIGATGVALAAGSLIWQIFEARSRRRLDERQAQLAERQTELAERQTGLAERQAETEAERQLPYNLTFSPDLADDLGGAAGIPRRVRLRVFDRDGNEQIRDP